MAESSLSSAVKSDIEVEEMLDQMLTRLALCDDSKLEPLLSKLLPLFAIPRVIAVTEEEEALVGVLDLKAIKASKGGISAKVFDNGEGGEEVVEADSEVERRFSVRNVAAVEYNDDLIGNFFLRKGIEFGLD